MKIDHLDRIIKHSKHEVLLMHMWGSRHLGIHQDGSDYDYRVYVRAGQVPVTVYAGGGVDVKYIGIDNLAIDMFNFDNLAVLYRHESHVADDRGLLHLLSLKEDIKTSNLPTLYLRTINQAFSKLRNVVSPDSLEAHVQSKAYKESVKRIGYDAKSLLYGYYLLDRVARFHDLGYDFSKVVHYEGRKRSFLMSMAHGEFTRKEAIAIFEDKVNHTRSLYEDAYMKAPVNQELCHQIEEIISGIVKGDIK